MHKQRTTWQYLAILAVLASSGLSVFAAGGGDQKDPPKPLPPEIVKAWRDAGAVVGWMKVENDGFVRFVQEKVEAGAISAFRFFRWKEGALAKLPDPGTAFGLDLQDTQVTDAGLKELAGLKSLRIVVPWLYAGDGRGAERAGRAEELAIAEP